LRQAVGTKPQVKFWTDPAPYRLFVGGRGAGKTLAGVVESLRMPRDTIGMVVAPTNKMLEDGAITSFLQIVKRTGVYVDYNITKKNLLLSGNRIIRFRSGDEPDHLRGPNIDWLWLDEAAMLDKDAWPTAAATLRGLPGKAWLTTTPRGKNWVYEMWSQNDPDYSVVTSKSSENVFLRQEYLTILRKSMTAEMFRQEGEGQFIDPIGSLFKYEWFNVVQREPEGLQWYRYWDLAASTKREADYTASIRAALAPDGKIYFADGIRMKAEWPDVRKVIVQTMRREADTIVGIEKAMHGLAAVQELRRIPEIADRVLRGIDVKGDKLMRAMGWAARAEDGKIALVEGEWNRAFIDESVSFPLSDHDDQVDAASGAVAMMSDKQMEWEII
jgi:predicted phage terminase large subunit-like protein